MSRKHLRTVLFFGIGVVFMAAGITWAQDATRPATSAAATSAPAAALGLHEGPLTIRITKVQGKVQYRTPTDKSFSAAKEGLELPEGTEFSTLPFSRLQFTVPPDQVFAIDRVTRVKITRASFRNGKLVFDAGMEFGRVRYDIEGAGIEHDSTIRSPNATLAVRGTQVSLFDQPPYTPRAISLTGTAQFRRGLRSLAFGGKGAGKVVINTASDNPADLALGQAVVDPKLQRARTASEATLIAQFSSRGSIEFFDTSRGIEVIRGGTPPLPMMLAQTLPGLNVFLAWKGNANLDLSVGTFSGFPQNEFLYPVGGLNSYPSGDKIPFDHQGGPKGGIEVANFPNVHAADTALSAPGKTLLIGASFISGKTADLTFCAFVDGKPLPNNLLNENFLQVPFPTLQQTVTDTVGPGSNRASATQLLLGQDQQLELVQEQLRPGAGGNPFPPPSVGTPLAAGKTTSPQASATAPRRPGR